MLRAIQDPSGSAAPAAESPGVFAWLFDLVGQKGVLEFVLAGTVLVVVWWLWWRMAALVQGAQQRKALADYLLGVEQALHGDLDGAFERLTAVVQTDPENHYARLLLGKVLAERGEPEQAHQQHLCLKNAFGIDTAANDRMLAQSLLAAGLPREAAEAAERSLQKDERSAVGWDFVYRARLQAGEFDAAAKAGKRLLQLLSDGGPHGLREDLARTFAQAGQAALVRGQTREAKGLLQHAESLARDVDAVPLLAARLDAEQRGVATAVQALLAAPGASALAGDVAASTPGTSGKPSVAGKAGASPDALPATTTANRTSATVRTPDQALPMAELHGLVPSTRWLCRACGAPLPAAVPECRRCLARGSAERTEPLLTGELRSPTCTMDAIEQNDAHLQRRIQELLGDDPGLRSAAEAELLELRERAVPALLRAAWQLGRTAEARAIATLRAMGPTIAPALFAASDELADGRLLPLPQRSPAHLVGRVVQGFDRSALPHVEPLFASAKPEHRKILIDFFLGLADLEQFQLVLERFPPVEILHRLNRAEEAVLRRFLQVVPRGHFLAESLLLEPTFDRDDVLLAAVPGAVDPDVLLAVLLRRGVSRTLLKVLLQGLGDPALADTAERVLAELGPGALEHALAAFADPERPANERQRLARVLVRGGAAAAEHLIEEFGPEPSGSDDELRTLLQAIGDAAVGVLHAAYAHSGWLEKVSIGLISRHTNRRVQIVLALRAIGSEAAIAALRALLAQERDANLRLRLQQALHGLGEGPREAAAGGYQASDGPDQDRTGDRDDGRSDQPPSSPEGPR